jgi:hypothetical protein
MQRRMIEYDLYILCSSDRFHETDLKLASELAMNGKDFIFVRTKFDQDINNKETILNKKLNQNEINELSDDLSQHIRNRLANFNLKPKSLFIVSALMRRFENIDNRKKYDFQKFQLEIIKTLRDDKREAFIFSVPLLGKEIVNLKTQHLKKSIANYSIIL